jgi:hypothetical protein
MAPQAREIATARHLGSGRVSAMLFGNATRGASSQLQLLDDQGQPLGSPVSAMVRAEGGFARMRARIDPHLAPGRYAAQLTSDAGSEKIDILVDPVVTLRIDPPVLKVDGSPGGRLTVDAMVANAGNVPAELPPVGLFGVFRKNGLEDAFGRAYQSDAQDGMQLFQRFVEGLRRNYGGLVRVRIACDGAVQPGQARAVEFAMVLPDALQSGSRYSGIWPLLNLNYSVQIAVAGDPNPHTEGASA